jgi:hypothetical protein
MSDDALATIRFSVSIQPAADTGSEKFQAFSSLSFQQYILKALMSNQNNASSFGCHRGPSPKSQESDGKHSLIIYGLHHKIEQ